jgi:hypothetical protein
MNCQAVQKVLLGSDRPDRPSAEASVHLARCGACREWLQRLVQIEEALPLLPVPSANAARAALVRRVLSGSGLKHRKAAAVPEANGQPVRRPSIAMVVGSWIMDPYASPRRRVAAGLVAGVAAALLLFVTGWLVWDATRTPQQVAVVAPGKTPPPADPLLAGLDKYKIKLRPGAKTTERIEALDVAADQLRERAEARPGDEDLIELARLYGDVVNERVVQLAEKLAGEGLSLEDRRKVLQPIAERLARAESQWDRLSQQTGLAVSAKNALASAARAARSGNERLMKLYKA